MSLWGKYHYLAIFQLNPSFLPLPSSANVYGLLFLSWILLCTHFDFEQVYDTTISTFINGMGVGYTARDTRTLASRVQEIPTGGFARVGANKDGNVLLTKCLIQIYLNIMCFFLKNRVPTDQGIQGKF